MEEFQTQFILSQQDEYFSKILQNRNVYTEQLNQLKYDKEYKDQVINFYSWIYQNNYSLYVKLYSNAAKMRSQYIEADSIQIPNTPNNKPIEECHSDKGPIHHSISSPSQLNSIGFETQNYERNSINKETISRNIPSETQNYESIARSREKMIRNKPPMSLEELRKKKQQFNLFYQDKFKSQPKFVQYERSGPDHAPIFKVYVVCKGNRGEEIIGIGVGNSKAAAEGLAANDVLSQYKEGITTENEPREMLYLMWSQKFFGTPQYITKQVGGSAHAPLFSSCLTLPDGTQFIEEGKSKKQAERIVAIKVLNFLLELKKNREY